MRPMKEFDPAKPATVHDRSFEWKPKTMQENYEKYATPRADGVMGRAFAGREGAAISRPASVSVAECGSCFGARLLCPLRRYQLKS